MKTRLPFSLLLACSAMTAGAASNSELAKQLDFNGNGRLDLDDEVRIGLLNQINPKKVDLLALAKKAQSGESITVASLKPSKQESRQLQQALVDLEDNYRLRTSYPLSTIDTKSFFGISDVSKPPMPPNTKDRFIRKPSKWKLRGSADAIDKDLEKASSALLGFSQNFENNTESLSIRGALGRDFSWRINPDYDRPSTDRFKPDTGFRSADIRLRTEFAKVDTGGGDDGEVDSLMFSFGPTGLYSFGRSGVLDSVRLTLATEFGTDFSFEKQVLGGNLEITPIRSGARGGLRWLTFNDSVRSLGPIRVVPQLKFNLTGGSVLDDAGNQKLIETEDYLRAGGTFGFTFYPENYEEFPLLLNCSYFHNWDLRSEGEDVSYIKANLEYQLKGFENVSLSLSYTEGEIPTTLEKDHAFSVGIGFKF